MKSVTFLLENLSHLTSAPILLLSKGKPLYSSVSDNPFWMDDVFVDLVSESSTSCTYLEERDYPVSYLLHCSGDMRCVLGPFSQGWADRQVLQEYSQKHHFSVPSSYRLPSLSIQQVRSLLELIHFAMTGEERSFRSVHLGVRESINSATPEQSLYISSRLQKYRLDNTENGYQRMSVDIETRCLDCIRRADLKQLKVLTANLVLPENVLATTSFKQEEYVTVIAVSLCSRAAIQAGVPHYQAEDLKEMLLRRTSQCTQIKELNGLRSVAMKSFISLVQDYKDKNLRSVPLSNAKQYIHHNLNQPLTLEEIASHAKISKSQLMALFRKYEQTTVMEFIWKERISSACYLLCNSDNSISQIAGYFYFSSPSHFSFLFKKHTGMTPSEYRQKHYILEPDPSALLS